jgi:5-methylcytosine-specific restriction enzyme A
MPGDPSLYGRKWKAARAEFLRLNPWCAFCARRGVHTRATVVDHIRPHKGNLSLFWSRGNWQPLCGPCHDGAKQAEERTGRVRGCDSDGVPLDPTHHWRTA